MNNKRARPDTTSPESNTQGQPAKKQITDMPGEPSEHDNNQDNKGANPLNPELMELKRQLFEGFDTLIDQKLSPLKKDIQELKNDRKLECSELNVETLTRKIKQSDAKHKKLKNRLRHGGSSDTALKGIAWMFHSANCWRKRPVRAKQPRQQDISSDHQQHPCKERA